MKLENPSSLPCTSAPRPPAQYPQLCLCIFSVGSPRRQQRSNHLTHGRDVSQRCLRSADPPSPSPCYKDTSWDSQFPTSDNSCFWSAAAPIRALSWGAGDMSPPGLQPQLSRTSQACLLTSQTSPTHTPWLLRWELWSISVALAARIPLHKMGSDASALLQPCRNPALPTGTEALSSYHLLKTKFPCRKYQFVESKHAE